MRPGTCGPEGPMAREGQWGGLTWPWGHASPVGVRAVARAQPLRPQPSGTRLSRQGSWSSVLALQPKPPRSGVPARPAHPLVGPVVTPGQRSRASGLAFWPG